MTDFYKVKQPSKEEDTCALQSPMETVTLILHHEETDREQ